MLSSVMVGTVLRRVFGGDIAVDVASGASRGAAGTAAEGAPCAVAEMVSAAVAYEELEDAVMVFIERVLIDR